MPQDFVTGLEQIRIEKAPDARTSIFQVNYEYKDNRWMITGESSVAGVEAAIHDLISQHFKKEEINFSFRTLPAAELANMASAIVRVSVANLRRQPQHTAEMVDQVLMGMPLKLLKVRDYWYLVQTPYDYIGWITRDNMQPMADSVFKHWQQSQKATVSVNFAQVFAEPSDESQIISDAVLGNVFIKGVNEGSWTEIFFPDRRRGFLQTSKLKILGTTNSTTHLDRETIVDWSKKMMGIPYLWGGHSTKGFDCSGLTSTVFRTQGYQLPRDANMQAELGEKISPAADYSNGMPGDLIFFGEADRIAHVGIYLGGSYFIHASGDVHISSLDPADALYDSYRKRTFRYIKRIIQD